VSEEKSLLGLYVPKQTLSPTNSPYLKVRDAEKWIASLPTAHVGETARLVYKALAEINRTSIPANQRLKLAELFRAPVTYVTDALERHFIGQAFPLSPKNQKVAELAREVHWELALSYKVVVEQSVGGFNQRVDGKELVTALQRAIQCLGLVLLRIYQVYGSKPEQIWGEMHRLYLFAEHNGLHLQAVKDTVGRTGSVADTYKQALLLALANPYRLPQNEIARIHHALAEWIVYADILLSDENPTPAALFAFNLESDEPPTYFAPEQTAGGQFVRLLETSQLTRIVRELVVETEQDQTAPNALISPIDPDGKFQQATLRRLILSWGAVPKRNFSRRGKNEPIKITLGLNATHHFIEQYSTSDQDTGESALQTDSEFAAAESTQLRPLNANPSPPGVSQDGWDRNSGNTDKKTQDFNFPGLRNWNILGESSGALPRHAGTFDEYPCQLLNESAGGCCLLWNNGTPTKAVVGMLAGIERADETEGKERSIGVIRWMRARSDNEMELGLELLAPSARAVATQNVTRKSKVGEFARGLLLPELRAINQPQTLIAPATYRTGDKLEITISDQVIKIRLSNILESTGTFSQFQFNVLRTVEPSTKADKYDRIKNFDSLWSSL